MVKKPISKTVSRPPIALMQASPQEKIANDEEAEKNAFDHAVRGRRRALLCGADTSSLAESASLILATGCDGCYAGFDEVIADFAPVAMPTGASCEAATSRSMVGSSPAGAWLAFCLI